jgi:hypothetical protein
MLFKEFYSISEMSKFTPTVRGGWNKNKILKYLKGMSTSSLEITFYRTMNSYKTFEEFKNNLYYHGSAEYGGGGLKPSIVFGKKWSDGQGGGGYGTQYWVISVSKSKRIASNFSGTSRHVSVYPVLIKPESNVIEMLNIKDSEMLEEHIEDLWNKGIDAVYIGGGEQELCIVNPKCAVVGVGESFAVFNIKVNDPTDEELMKLWDSRESKLKELEAKQATRQQEKKDKKEKDNANYLASKEAFENGLIKYKEDQIGVHELLRLYIDLSDKARYVYKITHDEKHRFKELVNAKDTEKKTWDKFVINNI